MPYRITGPGDSGFRRDQIVDDREFARAVRELRAERRIPPAGVHFEEKPPAQAIPVLVEDISSTADLEQEAMKLNGYLEATDPVEYSALFLFPVRGRAQDFIFVARRKGYRATLVENYFRFPFDPAQMLREDLARITRALKKPPLRPPWARP